MTSFMSKAFKIHEFNSPAYMKRKIKFSHYCFFSISTFLSQLFFQAFLSNKNMHADMLIHIFWRNIKVLSWDVAEFSI